MGKLIGGRNSTWEVMNKNWNVGQAYRLRSGLLTYMAAYDSNFKDRVQVDKTKAVLCLKNDIMVDKNAWSKFLGTDTQGNPCEFLMCYHWDHAVVEIL